MGLQDLTRGEAMTEDNVPLNEIPGEEGCHRAIEKGEGIRLSEPCYKWAGGTPCVMEGNDCD